MLCRVHVFGTRQSVELNKHNTNFSNFAESGRHPERCENLVARHFLFTPFDETILCQLRVKLCWVYPKQNYTSFKPKSRQQDMFLFGKPRHRSKVTNIHAIYMCMWVYFFCGHSISKRVGVIIVCWPSSEHCNFRVGLNKTPWFLIATEK